MSRIGKLPVEIPSGVQVSVADRTITVKGKSATLTFEHRPEVTVKVEDNQVVIERQDDSRAAKSFHGTTRSIVQNMVIGVTEGFKKELEVNGVGYSAKIQGQKLVLMLGYADAREVTIPMGVDVQVQGNKVTVSGPDKQAVGQFAAAARAHRKPEPYNHKGVKYADEVLIKKEGKAFAGGGA
jgi:large subunit ribosomal protein L6